MSFYLDRDQRLSGEQPKIGEASDSYRVDLSAATGLTSRWDLGSEVTYPDRRRADRRLLCYTSRPLERDMEVTGSPRVNLFLRSTASDGEFFAYLEDVDRKGRVSYVTEGELRALHRALSSDPPYSQPAPYHSFKRADSLPLRTGEVSSIDFARELGYQPADIPNLVEGTLPQYRATKLSPRPAGPDDLGRLFEESMVIW